MQDPDLHPLEIEDVKRALLPVETILEKFACGETASCRPVKPEFEGRNLAGEPNSFSIYHLTFSIWQRMRTEG
jgi:hypothetical protein